MSKAATDPRITKRKVTMTTAFRRGGQTVVHEATDYVREDFLDAYVEEARTRWQDVVVGDYDAGPGGYHGQTDVPGRINHPLAGQTFPATTPED
jgi:hypothetical protein